MGLGACVTALTVVGGTDMIGDSDNDLVVVVHGACHWWGARRAGDWGALRSQ